MTEKEKENARKLRGTSGGRPPKSDKHAEMKKRSKSLRKDNLSCVYALIDPRTNEPFWVGRTRALYKRWLTHCRGTPNPHPSQLKNRLLSMCEKGIRPDFVVLERFSLPEGRFAEMDWMQRFDDYGYDLLNEHLADREGRASPYIKDS